MAPHWFGELPNGWICGRLKSLGWIINGSTPRSGEPDYWDGDVVWVTPEDLGKQQGAEILESARHISLEGLNNCGASIVSPGAIIVSTRAPIGHLGIAKTPLCTNQGCRSIVPLSGSSSRYLYYLLFAARPELLARGRGSTFSELSSSDLGDVAIPLPPFSKQEAIADYLDEKTADLDALIEKKRKLLDLLIEERTALINQAVTKGLDPRVPMKDSGIPWIGEIPHHWMIKRLKHIVAESISGPYGSSLTKSMYTLSGYRVYGQQQVIPDNFSVGDYYISAEKYGEMSRYRVFAGDVLISVMGTVGRAAVVPDDAEPGIINPRLVRYRPKSETVDARFMQMALLSDSCQAQLKETAQGSTMDGLNMSILGDLRLALPPLTEQAEIIWSIRNGTDRLDQVRQAIESQANRLQEYRQALITAAVTGQLDIGAAA